MPLPFDKDGDGTCALYQNSLSSQSNKLHVMQYALTDKNLVNPSCLQVFATKIYTMHLGILLHAVIYIFACCPIG